MSSLRAAVATVFDAAQAGTRGHQKLTHKLLKVRREARKAARGGQEDGDDDAFFPEFVVPVHRLLLVKTREPAVERCVEFTVAFANACAREQATEFQAARKHTGADGADGGSDADSDSDADAAGPDNFACRLIDHLLRFHNAKDSAVRFRVCQLIAALFNNLDEEAEIEDDLWDGVVDAMVARCRDKTVAVRLQATSCLRRLHEPDDLENEATAELVALMHTDKAKEVRRVALSCLGMSRKTLPHIILCTRDEEPVVRAAAIRTIASGIDLPLLSIDQRVRLVEQGLRDRDAKVAKAAGDMLAKWLAACDFDVLELLSKFAIGEEEEVANLIVKSLIARSEDASSCARDSRLWTAMRTAPVMAEVQYWQVKEAALFWRVQCEHAAASGDEAALEDRLHLSSIMDFCSVLSENLPTSEAPATEETEFVCRQMLLQARLLDFAHDEAGRVELNGILAAAAREKATPEPLVTLAIETMMLTSPDQQDENLWQLAEIIAEVVSDASLDAAEEEEEAAAAGGENAAEIQQREMLERIEELTDLVAEKRAEKRRHVEEESYARAAQLKGEIEELEEQVAELENEFDVLGGADWGLQRGLSIAEPMLRRTKQTLGDCSCLAGLYGTLLVPAAQSEFPSVRTEVARCVGLYSLLDPTGSVAETCVPLLVRMASLDVFEVQVAAVQAISDLLMIFPGLQKKQADGEGDEAAAEGLDEASAAEDAAAADPISIILSFLQDSGAAARGQGEDDEMDEEDEEVKAELTVKMTTVAAEGLSRLMFNGRTRRTDVMAELLLLFFGNATEHVSLRGSKSSTSDPLFRIRQCLHVFFPEFARASVQNQLLIEGAAMRAFSRMVSPAATAAATAAGSPVPVEAFIKFVAFYLQERGVPSQAFSLGGEAAPSPRPASFHGRLAVGLLTHLLLRADGGSRGSGDEHTPVICKSISKLLVPEWDVVGHAVVPYLLRCACEGSDEHGTWDAVAKKSITRPLKTMLGKMNKITMPDSACADDANTQRVCDALMLRLRAKRGDLLDADEGEDAAASAAAPEPAAEPAPAKKKSSKSRSRKRLLKSKSMKADGFPADEHDVSSRSSAGSGRSSIASSVDSPLRLRTNVGAKKKKKKVAKKTQPAAPAFTASGASTGRISSGSSRSNQENGGKASLSRAEMLAEIDDLLSDDDDEE